jgi:serine/threonine protein kinase/Tfp pilus assembly protein PilF
VERAVTKSLDNRAKHIIDGLTDSSPDPGDTNVNLACGGDQELAARVRELLAAMRRQDEFLSVPTIGLPRGLEHAETRIGRYKLLDLLGEGGFGSVWAAEQREPIKRRVAIKVIKLGMDTKQVIARFEAERQALAMMDHPNIARVFDAGSTETGRPYFVMELVKGVPILEYCDTSNLDTRSRLELFTKVCLAIQHAHQKGIIHRDIKPSNILITMHDGVPVPKVIDFGIAKATNAELTEKTIYTQHRQMIGTPAYMSPEQAEMSGLDIDTRSDIYSLGVLLYELLTGTTPFTNEELMSKGFHEMMRIIREVEPPKPSTRLSSLSDRGGIGAGVLPSSATAASKRRLDRERCLRNVQGELDWIVMKSLEKDRQLRYESAHGLAMDIGRYLSGEAVMAAPPSTVYRLRKFVRRNRATVVSGGALAAALLIGLIAFAWQAKVARDQRDLALKARHAEAQQRRHAEDAEAEAEKQAAIAESVTKFLSDMLAAVKPDNLPKDPVTNQPMKDKLTVVQALEAAVKELDNGSLKDQPFVEARVRGTIGSTQWALTRFDDAEINLRKSLALRRAARPAGHPDIAKGLNNLALLLRDENKFAEAEQLWREALEIDRAASPVDTLLTTSHLLNLGTLLYQQNRLAEAEPLVREALEIDRAKLPANSQRIADDLTCLALILEYRNSPAEAEPLFREALAINRAVLPHGHPAIARALINLAQSVQQAAEAEPLCREALTIWRAALPAGHPDIAKGLSNLARAQHRLGKTAEARANWDEAIAILRQGSPRGSAPLAHVLWRSGLSRLNDKDPAAALPELEEAVAMAEKNGVPDVDRQLKLYRETLAQCRADLAARGESSAKGDGR